MKVVLDTNIWISALLLPESNAGKILAEGQATKFEIITSPAILDEIKRVLLYPKIQKRIKWDEAKIDLYIFQLKLFTNCISIAEVDSNIVVKHDHNDSPILHTLIASKAHYLVTGDNNLLVLKQDYPIITLSEFIEVYSATCFSLL